MKQRRTNQSAFLRLCVFLGLLVFFAGLLLALFAAANPQASTREQARHVSEQAQRSSEVPVAPAGGVYEAWGVRYQGPGGGFDEANTIAVDGAGNAYVAGTSFGSGTIRDYATIKYDSAGQQQWVARHNVCPRTSSWGAAIAVDDLGNVYVTGGDGDIWVTINYNASGEEQWVAHHNEGEPTTHGIAVDKSGNIYVTGRRYAFPDYDYLTIKYDSTGQEQWAAIYNGPENNYDAASAIAVDSLGNV